MKICKSCNKKKQIKKGFTCATCKREKKPSYWKERAWKKCSLYNRKKDIDKFTEIGYCCTCNKLLHWRDGDAGHFQSGRGNAILFYDKGIHLQCKKCNGPGKGEQYLYGEYIKNRYGKEEVLKQLEMKNQTVQYTIADYQRIEKGYDKKLAKLDIL